MFRLIFFEVHCWPQLWRRRLTGRLLDVSQHLGFVAVLGLAVCGAGGMIIWLAHSSEPQSEPARIHFLVREALRAQRRASDLQCLAENVYFEARGEPLDGQYAVAEVTLNRSRSENFPHTICAVVHETRWDPIRHRFTADFSWTELGTPPPQRGPAWKQAMAVAIAEYDDLREPLVPGALFYHATSVRPAWSRMRKAVATIGNHIFYL